MRSRYHFILLYIVHHHIRSQIHHFDAILMMRMEQLLGIVYRISNVFATWVPIRINQSRNGLLCLGIQFGDCSSVYQQCSGMLCTQVELHLLRILHTERVTIHTIAVALRIIQNGCLFEILQVTLVDSHFVPHLITGRNETISQIRIYFFLHDFYLKRLVGFPAFGSQDTMFYLNLVALSFCQQGFPTIQIRNHRSILAYRRQAGISKCQNNTFLSVSRFHQEIKGSNIRRQLHTGIFFHQRRRFLQTTHDIQFLTTGYQAPHGHSQAQTI